MNTNQHTSTDTTPAPAQTPHTQVVNIEHLDGLCAVYSGVLYMLVLDDHNIGVRDVCARVDVRDSDLERDIVHHIHWSLCNQLS